MKSGPNLSGRLALTIPETDAMTPLVIRFTLGCVDESEVPAAFPPAGLYVFFAAS